MEKIEGGGFAIQQPRLWFVQMYDSVLGGYGAIGTLGLHLNRNACKDRLMLYFAKQYDHGYQVERPCKNFNIYVLVFQDRPEK